MSRTSTGHALRLRFATELTGPCVRCLEPAVTELRIDAREVDQPPTRDEELRSPYVSDGELDVGRWANDAVVLALPEQPLCRPDCAGLCASAENRSTMPTPRHTVTRREATLGWRSCATSSSTVSVTRPAGG